jgi:hypothetical protein
MSARTQPCVAKKPSMEPTAALNETGFSTEST